MELAKCGCGSDKVSVKKVKVSAAHVVCGTCNTVGPTCQAETHDEVEVNATEAWNSVRSKDPGYDPSLVE